MRQHVRAAARVPMGQGFAGRIALSRQPLSIEDLSAQDVINPVLRAQGLRSLLGVPILADGRVLGVLHVGSGERRTFTADDVATLTSMADRIADAVDTPSAVRAHAAALILQRSLLPDTPREIDGLEVAARYVPAEGDLGGDWYDVFSLPDGTVGLVMGDVVGHGLASAVIMGRLRSALRSYALEHASPAAVLERLDRKVRHFEDGALATVLYAVTRPPYDRFVISCAGHWAPLMATADGDRSVVDVVHDPMLGIDGFRRHTTTVTVEPGATMCLFTDGLVERPISPEDDVLADPTEDQVGLVLAALDASDDPETACTRLIITALGDEVTTDDVALLVVRRTASAHRPEPGPLDAVSGVMDQR